MYFGPFLFMSKNINSIVWIQMRLCDCIPARPLFFVCKMEILAYRFILRIFIEVCFSFQVFFSFWRQRSLYLFYLVNASLDT